LNERDWLIITTLHEEKNITKTGKRLYISQPALTYRINQIEKKFGVLLFHRGRYGIDFTKEGELVASYAAEMLRKLKNLQENLSNQGEQIHGILRLGSTRTYSLYKLPNLLNKFSKLYPGIDFNVITDVSNNLIDYVLKNRLHVCFIRGNIPYWRHQKHTVATEKLYIVSNKEIHIEDLPSLPRIDGARDPSLKTLITDWWNENFSGPPLIAMTVDNLEITKKMVANGLGYTISPSMLFDEDEKDFFTIPLKDNKGHPLLWETAIYYRDSVKKLALVKSFIEFIFENAK